MAQDIKRVVLVGLIHMVVALLACSMVEVVFVSCYISHISEHKNNLFYLFLFFSFRNPGNLWSNTP